MEEDRTKSEEAERRTNFRKDAFGMIVYNFLIIFLIAERQIEWLCSDNKTLESLGLELDNITALPQYGVMYRLLNVFFNTLLIVPMIRPSKPYRNFLMPAMLYNFFTMFCIFGNLVQVVWTMYILQTPILISLTIFLSGIGTLYLYYLAYIQVVQYYDYLSCQT